MQYKTGYCFTARDMYDTFNLKQLKIKREIVTKKYGCHSKQDFCGCVLLYCFYLILLDIIENNVTFVLPTKGKNALIHVKAYTGDDFKRAYEKGKFKGIDFFESDFTGYQLEYRYSTSLGDRWKSIYISHNMRDRFYQLINEGKKYY